MIGPSRPKRPLARRFLRVTALGVAALLAFAACSGTPGASTPAGASPDAGASASTGTEACADPQAALDALATTVVSTGPNGEIPVPASELSLTDEEITKVKGMNATAAIVMHYGGNDWSQAQIDGQQTRFAELGIKVLAVTDANFDAPTQVSDIETVLAQNPDIIVSIPTDGVATAPAYQKAADAGVKIVFIGNVPAGWKDQKGYVSVVGADDAGNGVASAHLLAKAINCEGKVGLVFHQADFFVTKQRYDAVKKTLAESYPNIEIVDEQGIGGPDFTGDAEKVASAMLTQNPDLKGIWAVWDVPAEGVMAAARANGRNDLVISTIDLGLNVAVDLAKSDGLIKGVGAQTPYDQGVAEATLAAYALLGKEAPAAVALGALPVTRENVLEAWETVYKVPPPDALAKAAGQ